MQKLKIEEIRDKEIKLVIVSGGKKFDLWKKKKTGEITKAYEQFKKFGYEVGNITNAEIAESEEIFKNKKGETIEYTKRTILFFQEVDNLPVMVEEKPVKTQDNANDGVPVGNIEVKLDELLTLVKGIARTNNIVVNDVPEKSEEIKTEDLPF